MIVAGYKRGAALVVALFLVVGLAAVAMASTPGAQLDAFDEELSQLEEADTAGHAAEEIQRARQWLAEARAAQERRDDRILEYRVRRVDHNIDLIRALIQVGTIQASTQQQEERHRTAVQEIEGLEAEIRELEERKASRERELRRVQQGQAQGGER